MKISKKAGFLILAGSITLLCLIVAFAIPMIGGALDCGPPPVESSDIRQLGLILYSYAQDHDGNLPPNLETLLSSEWIRPDDKWVARWKPKTLYFPPDLPWNENPSEKIILVMHHPKGLYVYRIGNSMEFIKIEHED
jgi:hypothetical protein